jgi:hypothetical protein
LDVLLADYRDLGLPLPSPEARLVRWETSGVVVLADGVRRPMSYLAFEEPGAGSGGPRLLIGTERHEPENEGRVVPVAPGADAADGICGELFGVHAFGTNAALATAIQARARGWEALAARLYDLARRTEAGHHNSFFYEPAGAPPRRSLAMLARAHFANELAEPGSDWRSIVSRFEASVAMGPPALGDLGSFVRSIRATIEHRPAAPGSVEAKIDALCEMGGTIRGFGSAHEPPAFLRIVELGFDAVPALLAHLDDERLTRTLRVGLDNFPTFHETLADVVSDLLQGLAGEDIGMDWLRRQQGWPVERAAAAAWWARAKATGEEAYLVAHTLPAAADEPHPNGIVLLVLAHKYPQRLEDVYRAALARNFFTDSIAAAIASSALPDDDKRRILTAGAELASSPRHSFAALRSLRALDPDAYTRLLVRALDALPHTPTEPYWRAPESAASRLAAETSDPRVWASLLRAARRADVGLRMELLHTLSYSYLADRQLHERLAFLSVFLDDGAVPDVSKDPALWEGPRAAFTFPPLAVRDVAAMTIGSLLRLPTVPREALTRREWDAFGAEVRRRPELAALAGARR